MRFRTNEQTNEEKKKNSLLLHSFVCAFDGDGGGAEGVFASFSHSLLIVCDAESVCMRSHIC